MGSNSFTFKQFTIRQDQCAMKVGTDGVLLGAWTNSSGAKNILDIGTGTGLIALILAQREPNASIEAIEIEANAAKQASENVAHSPFSAQITVQHLSLNTYIQTKPCFDLIVSNPPFFKNSLKAPDKSRSLARHNDELSLELLFHSGKKLLNPQGKMALILPTEQEEESIQTAAFHQLYPTRILHVFPTPDKTAKRVCLEFSTAKQEAHREVLIIEKYGRHQYSEEYIALTKDFYLKF